jgi:anti-sigma B factor antagonist
MLQIKKSHQQGVTVLSLEGQLIHGSETRSLSEQLAGLLKDGEKRVLLDLAGVGFIDSSGVAELVAGYSELRRAGGDLKLCRPQPMVAKVFQVVKLTSRLGVCETIEAGLANLAASAGGTHD